MTRKRSPVPKTQSLIRKYQERLITIARAAELFREPSGETKSVVSVYRFTAKGCRGFILESVLDAGRLYTSKKAVLRFKEAQAIARGRLYGSTTLIASKKKHP